MYDITAVGEILIDLTQKGINEQGIPQFSANPGGAPANLAVAASRFGAKTAFIGKVGKDRFGEYLRDVLEKNGVSAGGLSVDEKFHTTLASLRYYITPRHDLRIMNKSRRERRVTFPAASLSAGTSAFCFLIYIYIYIWTKPRLFVSIRFQSSGNLYNSLILFAQC